MPVVDVDATDIADVVGIFVLAANVPTVDIPCVVVAARCFKVVF